MRSILTLCCMLVTGWVVGQSFPERCEGDWTGMMAMSSKGELRDSLQVNFTVEKYASQDVWTWRKEYISEKYPVVKDYNVRLSDTDGVFILDEGDGLTLRIDTYGNKAHSIYTLDGVVYTSNYELLSDGRLVFEVLGGSVSDTTANAIVNYSVDFVQRVEFERVE